MPGSAGRRRSEIILGDHVDAVVAVIDSFDPADGKVVLVGHSGGGAIADDEEFPGGCVTFRPEAGIRPSAALLDQARRAVTYRTGDDLCDDLRRRSGGRLQLDSEGGEQPNEWTRLRNSIRSQA